MKTKLTIAIIAGNAQKHIKNCLTSAAFADQIVIVAANSTDNTVNIIKSLDPKIKIVTTFDSYNKHFTKWRNLAFDEVKSEWVFYLDTDEVITPELKKELLSICSKKSTSYSYYVVPRENYFLNHRVRHGGTYPDFVKRLYHMPDFKGYTGILHEEPVIEGNMGYLKYPLKHYTHEDFGSMLKKSIAWTDMEAEALYKDNHPPVVWWRFIRMMLTKFYERLIAQSMWRDGIVGWMSVIFEMFDTYMIYARLYELQKQNA